jgi:phasin family protein
MAGRLAYVALQHRSEDDSMADKKNAPKAGKAKAAKPQAGAVKHAAPKAAAAKTAAHKAAPKAVAVKQAAPKAVAAKPAVKAAAPKPAAHQIVAAAKPAAAAVKTAAEATNKLNERTSEMQNEATQMIADRTQAAFGDMNDRTKTAIEKSQKIVEEMTEFTKGNVEAIVASSKVAARGVETLSQEAAEFGRRSFEDASATVKSFAEVRSPTDFFRLQSEFARAQFDAMVSESSKMSEAMIKLTGEVFEPITSRYSVAAERVKNIAA